MFPYALFEGFNRETGESEETTILCNDGLIFYKCNIKERGALRIDALTRIYVGAGNWYSLAHIMHHHLLNPFEI